MIYFSILSGLFYRFGGMGLPPLYRYWRRALCPIITLIAWILLTGFNPHYWLAYIIFVGLNFASLITYFDFGGECDNFWLTGFVYGIAALPLLFTGVAWYLILLRAIILAVTIGGLNFIVNKIKWLPFKDYIEELSRGFLLVFSLLLLH